MDKTVNYILRREGLPDITVTPEIYYANLRKRVQGMIGLFEHVCYTHEGGKDKSQWSEYTLAQFLSFRRKMLDIADEVGALNERIVIEDAPPESKQDAKTESAIEGFISSLFPKRS